MEKTIVIDGKQVTFKSMGSTPVRYKAQFGKDFFAQVMKLEKALPKTQDDEIDLEKLDFEVFYEIAWALAKTADPSIKDPLTWLDTFEVFPILEILPEIQDLIGATIQGKKK